MSDNTASRERAKKFASRYGQQIVLVDEDAIDRLKDAYLAGAREEAKVKDQIIRDLSDAMEVGKEIVSRSVALITDRDAEIAALKADKIDKLTYFETAKLQEAWAEIAALREAVRWAHGSLGDMVRDIWASAHPAVRRALEAKS